MQKNINLCGDRERQEANFLRDGTANPRLSCERHWAPPLASHLFLLGCPSLRLDTVHGNIRQITMIDKVYDIYFEEKWNLRNCVLSYYN